MAGSRSVVSDVSICKDCKARMKPLFTGFYCPNDCDKPGVVAARKSAYQAQLDALKQSIYRTMQAPATAPIPAWPSGIGNWIPAPPTPVKPPADDDCRDPYCGAKGTVVVTVWRGAYIDYFMYQCKNCSKQWNIYPNGKSNQAGNSGQSVPVTVN